MSGKIKWNYLGVFSCEILKFELHYFGTAVWVWPNRSKIVTHASSSGCEFGFNRTPLCKKSPFTVEWGWCVSSTSRLVNRTWCSLGYTGFRKKNQLFSVSVSAPLQSMALDVVLLLYPETYHLWAQPAIKLVFCLKYFMFLIGLGLWCGNTSQLWKIPWVIFSLHNPSQPGM